MSQTKLYIIIPVFNRKEFTRDCLLSLRGQAGDNFRVVVVDDGSTDGTEEMLRDDFPEVKILKGDGNLWWTGGVNVGIEWALTQGASHCMTLNNDTIAPGDFIEKTLKTIHEDPLLVFGPLEKDVESKKITYGGQVPDKVYNHHWLKLLSVEERKGLKDVHWLPGRGLTIPKEVFEKIGLFDIKNFPHYFADFDYTINARKAGFRVVINYDTELFTYPEESGEMIIRNQKKTFSGFYDHLFSIRGGANLKNYTRFQVKNSPKWLLPYILIEGYLRRIVGYWVR